MQLDEQLQHLAAQVPAPPPGNVAATHERGMRRRRLRRVGRVTAVVAVIGAVTVGTTTLTDAPPLLDIADRPTTATERQQGGGAGPSIAQAPVMTVADDEPHPWAVAVSGDDDGHWCATAVRGSTEVADQTGRPCERLLTPTQSGSRGAFGSHHSDRRPAPSGDITHGLSWGFAPAAADRVVVRFTDGTTHEALTASDDAVDATLWAVAYEGVELEAVQALEDGVAIAGFTVLD